MSRANSRYFCEHDLRHKLINVQPEELRHSAEELLSAQRNCCQRRGAAVSAEGLLSAQRGCCDPEEDSPPSLRR